MELYVKLQNNPLFLLFSHHIFLKAIKFVNTASTPDAKTISAIDHGILELRTAVFNVHKQVDDIQDRCETYVFINGFLFRL